MLGSEFLQAGDSFVERRLNQIERVPQLQNRGCVGNILSDGSEMPRLSGAQNGT